MEYIKNFISKIFEIIWKLIILLKKISEIKQLY